MLTCCQPNAHFDEVNELCIPPHFGCFPGPSTCFVRSRDICRMRMPRTRTTGSTAPTVLPATCKNNRSNGCFFEDDSRSLGKACFSCWMLHVPDMIHKTSKNIHSKSSQCESSAEKVSEKKSKGFTGCVSCWQSSVAEKKATATLPRRSALGPQTFHS